MVLEIALNTAIAWSLVAWTWSEKETDDLYHGDAKMKLGLVSKSASENGRGKQA
jgi:hypothetical protein